MQHHVCSTHVGSTMCAVVMCFWTEVTNVNSLTFAMLKIVVWEDLNTLPGVPLQASYPRDQPVLYVHLCMYVRRCGSLYHVGIRPLALVLITLPCLLRPCNLPPLKCGFKKKRINPLALVVSTLSVIQPTLKVSVLVAPPRPHIGPLPPTPAGRPPFSQLRC